MEEFAVLTGDIVDSSSFSGSDLRATMEALAEAAREVSGWGDASADSFAATFSLRGGDGWQIALQPASFAVRTALFLQATLRSMGKTYASRIAVAVGPGQLPETPRPDLNAAHGPAFTNSGRRLDKIRKPALMAHDAGGAEAAALRLADHISQSWTQAQARAIAAALRLKTGPRAEIAEQLGISRQAVNQALWSAGFLALSEALDFLEGSAK